MREQRRAHGTLVRVSQWGRPGVDLASLDATGWDDARALLDASVGLPAFALRAIEHALALGWRGTALVDAFNVATVSLEPASTRTPTRGDEDDGEALEREARASIARLLALWAAFAGGQFSEQARGLRVRVPAYPPREESFDEARGDEGDPSIDAAAAAVSARLAALSALGLVVPLEVLVLLTAATAESHVRVRVTRLRGRIGLWRALEVEVAPRVAQESTAPGDAPRGVDEAPLRGLREALARWLPAPDANAPGASAVFLTPTSLRLLDLCDERALSSVWRSASERDA